MARLSVATNDSYGNAGVEWVTKTQWHNIVAWGKVTDMAEKTLDKGSTISLEDKLMNSTYVYKNGKVQTVLIPG